MRICESSQGSEKHMAGVITFLARCDPLTLRTSHTSSYAVSQSLKNKSGNLKFCEAVPWQLFAAEVHNI